MCVRYLCVCDFVCVISLCVISVCVVFVSVVSVCVVSVCVVSLCVCAWCRFRNGGTFFFRAQSNFFFGEEGLLEHSSVLFKSAVFGPKE